MLDQLKLEAVLLKNIEDLRRVYNNISSLKIGSLYHAECATVETPYKQSQGKWTRSKSFVSRRYHIAGRLLGFSHYPGTLHIRATLRLLATDLSKRQMDTKSGDCNRTIEIPAEYYGEDAPDTEILTKSLLTYGQVLLGLREIHQEDLLGYVGDPHTTALFKRLLSGGTIRARRTVKT